MDFLEVADRAVADSVRSYGPPVRIRRFGWSRGDRRTSRRLGAWGFVPVREPFQARRRGGRYCGGAASSSVPCRRRSPRGGQRALRGSTCRVCPAASSRSGDRGHRARDSRAHGACRSNGSGITGQFVPKVPAPRSSLLRSALPAPEPRYGHRSNLVATLGSVATMCDSRDGSTDDQTDENYSILRPDMARAITSCWISDVPSKIVWVSPGRPGRAAQCRDLRFCVRPVRAEVVGPGSSRDETRDDLRNDL